MPVGQARGGTLILGGGFGGAYVARSLGSRGATIVSLENFMLFSPMLPEAASGMLEPRHCVVPLRMMCPHAELLLGRATAVDEDAQTVTVETDAGTHELRYDNLVVAVGSVSRVLPIPGLADHGLGFHDLADAIRLRNHVLRRLEAAAAVLDPADVERELTFVFVGAGYAGVEALAELRDLVSDALRYYPTLKDAPQKLGARGRGAEDPRGDSQPARRVRRRAARRSEAIDIRVSTTLESAEVDAVMLSDGSRIPTRTLVWTAGVRPRPVVSQFGLPLDDRGRIRVDSFLRVEGRSNVWALGDAVRVPNEATPDHPDPPTSQHALRQARRLARNLTGTPEPYRFRMLGQVATLGRYKGIAELPGHIRLRGFVAWWVTRSYHLYQVPLLSRKLRVVTDWTVALFFRRDIAEFSLLQQPHRLGE